MSYIIYTCDCGAKAEVYQYNLDGPARRPQGWSQDRLGDGVCPDCTQASLKPKTIAEKLDAAQTGQEFGAVLSGLFSALERARDNEEEEK